VEVKPSKITAIAARLVVGILLDWLVRSQEFAEPDLEFIAGYRARVVGHGVLRLRVDYSRLEGNAAGIF
jgi:hypothetical protein